jgi:1,4-dihydroxy-2-naphthoate octaprenyltransferase
MLIASCAIQIATNLFNEYYDYVRGLDTKDSVGIGGTIVHDGASPKFVLNLALGLYGLAALLGIYICYNSSWYLLLIGAFCMLIGYLYTGGPFPISASPFGELFAGGFLGTGVICISYFIQTGSVTWHTVAISVPVMVLIGLILTGNNIRDRVGDAANGRRTLVILLGHKRSVQFLNIMFMFCYAWIAGMILFGGHSAWLLATFLTIPTARQAVEKFRPEGQTPQQMMAAMVLIPKTNTRFGLALALGLLVESFFALF